MSIGKITNEKVFKYQSAGDKTIEIVESAKLPQLAHHLRPIFGLAFIKSYLKCSSTFPSASAAPSIIFIKIGYFFLTFTLRSMFLTSDRKL